MDNASTISNVAAATTLGPPHLTIEPPSASASLFTGGRTTQVVSLGNSGVGELTWNLEGAGGLASPASRSPRSSARGAVAARAGRPIAACGPKRARAGPRR